MRELKINTDIACPKCGKLGATGEEGKGICMECISKALRGKPGERFTGIVLQNTSEEIQATLESYQERIDRAFKAQNNELKIALGITFTQAGTEIFADVEISFHPSAKIKEKYRFKVADQQQGLFRTVEGGK